MLLILLSQILNTDAATPAIASTGAAHASNADDYFAGVAYDAAI